MKKDKQKIIDEVWTEERVRSFLQLQPAPGFDADFHRLRRAYQSMRADDFRLFLAMFKEAGMDINAQNPQGKTLLEEIAAHRHAGEFVEAIREAGAQ